MLHLLDSSRWNHYGLSKKLETGWRFPERTRPERTLHHLFCTKIRIPVPIAPVAVRKRAFGPRSPRRNETGLLPVGDIRNLRKTTDRYGQVEYEKTQLERTLSEHGEEQLLESWASKKMEETIL